MSNRIPYNTVTGRAFYNPTTGRAFYIDQHVISAFSGAITFETGIIESPTTITCYTGPGSATDFGYKWHSSTRSRIANLNKIEVYDYGMSISPYLFFWELTESFEYLPSKNELIYHHEHIISVPLGPGSDDTNTYIYKGLFGESTPTAGIDGVYDTVISQQCSHDRGQARTTDQTFAFTISS